MAEFLTFYRVDVISPFCLLPSSAPFSHCHCSPLFFTHIYKIIMAITMLSGSDMDLCPREMQGPATGTSLLLLAGGDAAPWAVSPTEQ